MDTRLQPNNQLLDQLRNQQRGVFNDEKEEILEITSPAVVTWDIR
jgi:hypothetical protein